MIQYYKAFSSFSLDGPHHAVRVTPSSLLLLGLKGVHLILRSSSMVLRFRVQESALIEAPDDLV